MENLIGNTPIVVLPQEGAVLLAKLEKFNATGSAKDRAAWAMLRGAEERGELRPGGTVVEATSGNTGIALAALAAAKGYRCVIAMPENMSRERQQLMAAFGAELLLTPAGAGMAGAVAAAREIHGFYVNQFENPDNVFAHYSTTGPEIWRDTGGRVDIFVAGVGTGGTVTGVGRYLKEKKSEVRTVGVLPERGSAIPGIGAGFTPGILEPGIPDEMLSVTAADAMEGVRTLARLGLFVGSSSGAAWCAAKRVLARPENRGKTAVVLFADGGERYLSALG